MYMSDKFDINQYINASGANQLKDNASIAYFNDTIQPRGYLGASKSKALATLDTILEWYNLKRASCLQAVDPTDPDSYLVRILVPIDTTDTNLVKSLSTTALGKIYTKLKYRDLTVKVSKDKFKDIDKTFSDPNSVGCQNLYVVYCKNMIESYKKANDGKLDDGFVNFRPECSCFVPIPDEIAKTGINVSPLCIMPGCDNVVGVYLDPVSRGNKNCDLTICQSNVNFSNLRAGGNITLENKLVQTCGGEEKVQQMQKTPPKQTNLISDIPYISSINDTSFGKYINATYDKNATSYLLGFGTFGIVFCIVIIMIIAAYFFLL